MAHELGHVRMIWHLDSVFCHTAVDDLVDEGLKAPRGGAFQEQEANRFAGALLIPRRFLESLVASGYEVNVPEVLDALAAADVSVAAGLLALREVLLPGYVFDVDGLSMPIQSPGTRTPAHLDRWTLGEAAVARGTVRHQGKSVRWYQLAEKRQPQEPIDDERSSGEVLAAIVGRLWASEPGKANSITSSIGGALSSRRELKDPAAILGLLQFRLQADPQGYGRLLDDPEGAAYLSKRALEIARKRGWKAP
jgi:hypothetical protein